MTLSDVKTALENKSAWKKFRELVIAQNGDVSFIDDPKKLPEAHIRHEVKADRTGYISQILARTVGETAVDLGAGRAKKTDSIDLAVGILVHKKVGEQIRKGDVLFTVLSNDSEKAKAAEIRLKKCIGWSDIPCESLPLFYGVIS